MGASSQNFSALLKGMTRLASVHLCAETAQSRSIKRGPPYGYPRFAPIHMNQDNE
jgi:hypothetical protein